MITWQEYKEYKKVAEKHFQNGLSRNDDIQYEILRFELKEISKEQCLENIINVLSSGEHFKPLN